MSAPNEPTLAEQIAAGEIPDFLRLRDTSVRLDVFAGQERIGQVAIPVTLIHDWHRAPGVRIALGGVITTTLLP